MWCYSATGATNDECGLNSEAWKLKMDSWHVSICCVYCSWQMLYLSACATVHKMWFLPLHAEQLLSVVLQQLYWISTFIYNIPRKITFATCNSMDCTQYLSKASFSYSCICFSIFCHNLLCFHFWSYLEVIQKEYQQTWQKSQLIK